MISVQRIDRPRVCFTPATFVILVAAAWSSCAFAQESPDAIRNAATPGDKPSSPAEQSVVPEQATHAEVVAEREDTPSRRRRVSSGRRSRSAAALESAALGRFADSEVSTVYLEQNWTAAEALEFYSLRQGSPLMHKDVFNALEQPQGTGLFRESAFLAKYGFLPQRAHALNPDGYPIGFVAGTAIELNCSACHTSRILHAGREYRIDGSQAMTDVEKWLRDLALAMQQTLDDAPTLEELEAMSPLARYDLDPQTKFGRFAKRILRVDNPRVSRLYGLLSLLERQYDRRQRYNDYNDFGRRLATAAERESATTHEPYGPGRLDALGAILNQACAEAMQRDGNAAIANAPVNYPAIWDAPQHTHVQWNGAVDNTALFGPLGRNAGQVIGVFGLVELDGDTLVGYDSSIRFEALERAEQLITKLWSPLWPAEFGRDNSLIGRGETVYNQNCRACHAVMKRDDPARQARDVLIPIDRPAGQYPPLGTDPLTATNWNDRQATVDILAGRYVTRPLGTRFPRDRSARIPSREVLTHVIFGAIARSFVPWREELTLESAAPRSMLVEATVDQTLLRYKARPLNGVWSTAPYLHNGSVLNMTELLTPPADRKRSFRVGATEYEPATLGFKDDGPFTFDTTKLGNSNAGHVYGTELPSDDKRALLEYLKGL